MKLILDPWQKEVLETNGNICLRSGRQVGKSTIISIKAAQYAVFNPNKTVLVIASVERQAYMLFEKTLAYLVDNHSITIKKGQHRPTKHKINLKNGSTILCYPTGMTGYGIRGLTVDLLIADEAAFIQEEVWSAVTPMLATTRGTIILLSTPHGKKGYYYNCFNNENFTSFHISAEDSPRKDVKFLESEKLRMTKVQYAQEYLGEFVDELMQFFPTDIIKKCMTIARDNSHPIITSPGDKTYLGVDVARMGDDDSVLITVRKTTESLTMLDMEITQKTLLKETTLRILNSNQKYNFKKIYIDDGGMGVGVFEELLTNDQTKRKVVAINNASRPLDKDERRKKKILKEDLYNNLLRLLELQKIELFDDPEIMVSLRSVQFEYTDEGNLKIFGDNTHIAEGLIRAAWCIKDKSLNVYIY